MQAAPWVLPCLRAIQIYMGTHAGDRGCHGPGLRAAAQCRRAAPRRGSASPWYRSRLRQRRRGRILRRRAKWRPDAAGPRTTSGAALTRSSAPSAQPGVLQGRRCALKAAAKQLSPQVLALPAQCIRQVLQQLPRDHPQVGGDGAPARGAHDGCVLGLHGGVCISSCGTGRHRRRRCARRHGVGHALLRPARIIIIWGGGARGCFLAGIGTRLGGRPLARVLY